MASAAVVGSTGFVGSYIISNLIGQAQIATISAFARRPLEANGDPQSCLSPVIEHDAAKWAEKLQTLQPAPTIFFSALGTTRAQAGGVANQRKIDFDLNLELARAAKKAGVKVYVLISSAGASKTGLTAYQKMKAELDEAVTELDFEKTVILRPGFLTGNRKGGGIGQWMGRAMADALGKCSGGRLKNSWAQDAHIVANAAVNAGLQCLQGNAPAGKVWMLHAAEILAIGQT